MEGQRLIGAALVVLCWLHPRGFAAADPIIDIDSWYHAGGDTVSLHMKVKAFSFPADGHAVNVYLDDELQWSETQQTSLTLEGLPAGQHAVSLVAAENKLGHYLEFTNPSATATLTVRVELPCAEPGDPSCDDGNPCSLDYCQKTGEKYTCQYGIMPYHSSCCDSKYECSGGALCINHGCGPCPSHGDCDDGNSCTADQCVNGACVAQAIPGCCNIEGPCDDLDPCTVDDHCDGATCTGMPVECADVRAGAQGEGTAPETGGATGGGCHSAPGRTASALPPAWLACFTCLGMACLRRARPRAAN